MDKIGIEVSIYYISRETEIYYSSIYGRLHNCRKQYCRLNSFLGMGLVEARHIANNLNLFLLPGNGRKMAISLK
jgi:predicted transcriptional regulator with HTH domain